MSDELQNPAQDAQATETADVAKTSTEATAVPLEETASVAEPATQISAPPENKISEVEPVAEIKTEPSSPVELADTAPLSPAPQTLPTNTAVEMDKKFYMNMSKWKEHLALALTKRAARKQAKLDKVLALAQSQGTITNQQVKKLLRCGKLTAWRYLKTLEKQNQLRRTGSHNVPSYEVVK